MRWFILAIFLVGCDKEVPQKPMPSVDTTSYDTLIPDDVYIVIGPWQPFPKAGDDVWLVVNGQPFHTTIVKIWYNAIEVAKPCPHTPKMGTIIMSGHLHPQVGSYHWRQ